MAHPLAKVLSLLVAMAGGGLLSETALAQSTPTFTTLYSFGPYGGTDGALPYAPLIFDSSGALIGTTQNIGSYAGCGTVFKLTPPSSAGGSWTEALLLSFDASGSGGCGPVTGVVADALGALYGTTQYTTQYSGNGTVFMLTPSSTARGSWSETVLHRFSGTDGANPQAGLMFDSSGALNGTTSAAGTLPYAGTVFNMSPPFAASSAFATTHFFTYPLGFKGGDGFQPLSGLIADASDALYGTTAGGGQSGGGTIFKMTPPPVLGGTWTETLLYSFTGGPDGGTPYGGSLLFGASGVIYGTTQIGGLNFGTVFQLTPPSVPGAGWTEVPIWSFTGGSDGAYPQGGLIADASGALYGTTANGGTANAGVIFKLTPPSTAGGTWTQTVLYTFTGGTDDGYPSTLIPDASGALYGTTPNGGVNGMGSVFKLTTPANFYGAPGKPNCVGQSVSTLTKTYGSMPAAAKALGYPNVKALQKALASYCGG